MPKKAKKEVKKETKKKKLRRKQEKEVSMDDKIMNLINDIREGSGDRRFSITSVFSHCLQRSVIKNIHDLQDIFLSLEKKKLIYNIGGTLWTTLRVRKART